jgi:hypothetical protein
MLTQAIMFLVFYSLVDVASVTVALLNPDGSFERPVLGAVIFGTFWTGWVLLSLYLLVAYFRERWTLSDDAVSRQGVIWFRSLPITEVTSVRWFGYPAGGSVVLRGAGQKLTLWLGHSPKDEQVEIVEFVRNRLPTEIQTGWQDYVTSRDRVYKPIGKSRWVAACCGLLLAGCGGAFLYCWWVGMGFEWGLIGEMSLVAAVWYLLRAVKGPRIRKPEA